MVWPTGARKLVWSGKFEAVNPMPIAVKPADYPGGENGSHQSRKQVPADILQPKKIVDAFRTVIVDRLHHPFEEAGVAG